MSEKTIRYKDLPVSPTPGQLLKCLHGCQVEWSATRGDYCFVPPDEPITCGECGAPLELVERVVSFEPVEF